MFEFITKNPARSWKWATIVVLLMLVLSTCSHCSTKQNNAWVSSKHQAVIDSLQTQIQYWKDSVALVNGKLELCEERAAADEREIEYLRGVIKDNNTRTPIIIYKDSPKEQK